MGTTEIKCECGTVVKENVKSYSQQHFGKTLCFPCQNIERSKQSNSAIAEETKNVHAPKSDVVKIKGKDFVTYAGLLKKAHAAGLLSIEIEWQQVDFEKKCAACIVRAKFPEGKIFDGFGSSTPDNSGGIAKDHFVELAHTRSKSRALRDALNIGTVAKEELSGDSNSTK
ncbi:MAG TPA: hypothetical protein ENH82_19690 [bacterium]|nr:hypothetical protein [bacterium]